MQTITRIAVFLVAFLIHFSSYGQNIIHSSFYSQALGENKNVNIYLPPGYQTNTDLYYPVIYYLHGHGGSENSAGTTMQLAESLINQGIIEPLIIVCANNNSSPFYGSFYVNSSLNGNYEDYMTIDLITWIESNYRVVSQKKSRTLMGQSMGGYGSFRYGILFKDRIGAIATHGAAINFDEAIQEVRLDVLAENPSGSTYYYDFYNTGSMTKMIFALGGAFTPNNNTPQTYINPQYVEFPLDENGLLIDSVYQKWELFDPVNYINLLTPDDSVAILFGAGSNDELHLYNSNVIFKDTLDKLGLAYEFYDHTGSHAMPSGFRERALIFLDSIMHAPGIPNSCISPSGLSANQLNNSSVSLSWSENGSANSWQIRLGETGFDTNGITPVSVNTNPYTWTSLSENTTYDWYIRADCGTGDFSDWVGPNTFYMPGSSIIFFEDWESQSGSRNTDGLIYSANNYSWSFETSRQNEGRVSWGQYAHQAHDGSGALTLDRSSRGTRTSNLALLTLDLSGRETSTGLELSFWWVDHKDEEHDGDKVWIRGSDSDTWVEIYDIDPRSYSNNVYNFVSELDIDSVLSNANPAQVVSSTFQLRFGQEDNFNVPTDGLSFDDITIKDNFLPTFCPNPSNLSAGNIATNSADLSWTENGTATSWHGFFGIKGFDTTGMDPVLVTENPYVVTGLNANTDYEFYVRAYCGTDNSSQWIGPYSFSTNSRIRKLPYLILNGDNTQMEIHWQLFENYSSTLDWGTDTNYGSNVNTSEYGSDHQHKYTILSLIPATKYFYRITVGNEIHTGSFKSAPAENASNISFFVYGDHRTFPERHDSIAKKINEFIAASSEDQTFILSTGDLVSQGNDEEDWDVELFNTGYPNINAMLSKLPFLGSMGNHEQDGLLFAKYLPYPYPNGGGSNGNYWSFDYGNIHVTIVDQYVDYSEGSDQHIWLTNDLSSTSKPWKIIALHEPGWSAGYYPNNTDVQNVIQPLCETYGVQLVFAGHHHYYSRAFTNEVTHITTGGGGSNLYDPLDNQPNVVVAEKAYHFCKININGDLLRLIAIDKEGDTIDNFTINISSESGPPPIAHWPLDNTSGTTATDNSGNDLHGTLVNGAQWDPNGKFYGAVSFDGLNDYIEIPDNDLLDPGANDFTVSFWINKRIATSRWDNIWGVSKWNTGASPGSNEWTIGVGDNGNSDRPYFIIENGTTSFETVSPDEISLNEWHLLTGVREGTEIKLYVDAVLMSTTTVGLVSVNNVGRNVRIANSRLNNLYTDGLFDDIRIYDRALNVSEILALSQFANGAPIVDAGPNRTITLPVDFVNLAGTATDDGLPEGSILTSVWNKYSGPGNVIFGDSTVLNTTATFSEEGTYLLELTASDGLLSSSDTMEVVVQPEPSGLPGPIAHWALDNTSGTTVTDSSSNNLHGVLVNGAQWDPNGKFNGGVSCDGINDFIEIPDNDLLDPGANDFTVSFWIKKRAATYRWDNTWGVCKWKTGGAPGSNEWLIGVGPTGNSDHPYMIIENATTTYETISPDEISLNEWHLLTGVREGNEIKLYVDAVLMSTTTVGAVSVNNAGRNIRVANSHLNNLYTNGIFDDIRIYDRALSASEIFAFIPPVPSSLMSDFVQTNTDITICQGDSIFAGGDWQKSEGSFIDNFKTQRGYDSISIVNLMIEDQPVVNLGADIDSNANEVFYLDAHFPGAVYRWQDGSTDHEYLVSKEGDYYVVVTNLCGSVTDSVSVTYNKSLSHFEPHPITVSPNPFLNSIHLTFGLNNHERVIIAIYNVQGDLVKILINNMMEEGVHKLTWDGTGDAGQTLQSGVYLLKLITKNKVDQKTIVKVN